MNKERILKIVNDMCNFQSMSCRGLDMVGMARQLLDIGGVPSNAEIWEIPLNQEKEVVILFEIPGDEWYYSLFAGIGLDGKFYFQFTVDGIYPGNEKFSFLERPVVLPVNWWEEYKGTEVG